MISSTAQRQIDRAQFKGELNDYVIDGLEDYPILFAVIESEGQHIEFRVGPVFYSDDSTKTGLWIAYQEKAFESKRYGPVLMSLETFDKLVGFVNKKRGRGLKNKLVNLGNRLKNIWYLRK